MSVKENNGFNIFFSKIELAQMTKAQGHDTLKVTGNLCVKLKLLINFQSKTRIVHYFYNGLKLSQMITGQIRS